VNTRALNNLKYLRKSCRWKRILRPE